MLAFVKDVRVEISGRSHRGNIYSAAIEGEVKVILPSLIEALKVASGKMGVGDGSGVEFLYDWEGNRVERKLEYELSLR